MKRARAGVAGVVLMAALAVAIPASAGAGGGDDPVAAHWTAARRAAAQPRDLVVDARGLGYLRRADGTLQPHGHSKGQLYATPAASKPTPAGKPSGGGTTDSAPPTIGTRTPANNATVGTSQTFTAVVTDLSGVRSVTIVIGFPNSTQTQSFAATLGANNTWSTTINGFTAGTWRWHVVAKDRSRAGNVASSPVWNFTVGGGGGGGGTTANAPWTTPGTLQTAAGRIFFEMPTNQSLTNWGGYVCSGTVATDSSTGRSVIITAAHCVYDDAHKVFARNVLFIPNQDETSVGGTDTICGNDPLGCWKPKFGVVDNDWASNTFPDNVKWDYAFYVVNDDDPLAHTDGFTATGDVLDVVAGDLDVVFSAGTVGQTAHALGYSYSEDPNFMYCSEPLGVESAVNWWLDSCDLSGGSSGGPWVQPMTGGEGPIFSVNSWGYSNQPGMAGPRLDGITSCLFTNAKGTSFTDQDVVDERGVVNTC